MAALGAGGTRRRAAIHYAFLQPKNTGGVRESYGTSGGHVERANGGLQIP